MTRFVVVGGGAAGMSAASVAKRRDPEMDVVVLEAGGHISFSACGIPYWVGEIVPGTEEALVVVSVDEAREERGLDVRIGARATGVDPASRTLTYEDASGGHALAYDALCLAPGTEPLDPFGALGRAGVHGVRHLDDGIRLKRAIDDDPPERACVVGGGFVGVEVAEGLVHRGIPTTLVHSGATLLTDLVDAELGEHVNEAVEASGVELLLGERATGVADKSRAQGVVVGERTVEADLVVLAVGVRPHTQLAESAGCRLGPTGAIEVDAGMRTSVDGVYAAGDCVEFPHRLTGEPVFLPLALHANRAGRIVGENVAGGDERFPGVLGTAITKYGELEVAATGLTLASAKAAGFDAVARTVRSVTKAGYFPGVSEVHVKLVVERASGRLLGAQLVGGPGAAKRIDTVAAAIWMGATAEDVEAMDLAYAPPFSPTWDPVAIAARIAGRAATGPSAASPR